MPFLNLLLEHAFWVDLGTFQVRAPWLEAFFVHKLIAARRRPEGGKRSKDLEKCAALVRKLKMETLECVMRTVNLSSAVRKALRTSAEAIAFPPQSLGIA